MTIRDTSWMDRAACAQVGPAFHDPADPADVRMARAICEACPVRQACADYALAEFNTTNDTGVWGGTTERGRRALRKETT